MKRKLTVIIAVLLVAAVGVFIPIANSQGMFSRGNAEKYSAANMKADENSPIKGKTYIFLGSSVTYGSAAKGESFVDFLEKKDGIKPIKEAVSGTCLVDEKSDSYVSRLKKIDKNIKPDALICQLSTNDATKKKPLGKISGSFEEKDFDTKTVAGAIEYIIAYSKNTWGCPVIFYTGTKYNSEQYEKMVQLLWQIQRKWRIQILDLWNDEDMNGVSKKDYRLYMANGIHPTRAGYRDWWLPKFEEILYTTGDNNE